MMFLVLTSAVRVSQLAASYWRNGFRDLKFCYRFWLLWLDSNQQSSG
jgi:hypothetical protein